MSTSTSGPSPDVRQDLQRAFGSLGQDTCTPGLPDPELVVGDWTGESESRVQREALAYRQLRTSMRAVFAEALRRRETWAKNTEDPNAVARAVAYQSVAGLIQRGLDDAAKTASDR
jgi:hypothetical protein